MLQYSILPYYVLDQKHKSEGAALHSDLQTLITVAHQQNLYFETHILPYPR